MSMVSRLIDTVLGWVMRPSNRYPRRGNNFPELVTTAERGLEIGDFVVLTGTNHWKGCLKVGKPYEILHSFPESSHIQLECDNGTRAYFRHDNFVKYNGVAYRKMPGGKEAALEYEDMIAANEIYESLTNGVR